MDRVNAEVAEFGQRLRELRLRANRTQDDLAAALGVKRQTVGAWESGTTAPDVRIIFQLRHLLRDDGSSQHLDLAELLGERRPDVGRTPLEYAVQLLTKIDAMGVRDVHPNRSEGLASMLPIIERERASISIVASSFLGIIRVAPERVSTTLMKRVQDGVALRILMTHPSLSSLREEQEGRVGGTIKREIRDSVSTLQKWGVPSDNIRFYKGAPTIFMLFTPDRMLANPYTYMTEAFKTLTIEVSPTSAPGARHDDVYRQYELNHFRRPWDASEPYSPQVEDLLKDGL